MCHFKTTTATVKVEVLIWINKGADKFINKITGSHIQY